MAKAKIKVDLSIVKQRDALKPKPNRAPWTMRLRPGLFLGYRPTADGSAGTWAAKTYVNGKEQLHALESFGQFAPNERYAKAKAAAEEIMAIEESGGRSKTLAKTVADACRAYVDAGNDSAQTKSFFNLSVYNDEIGLIELKDLRRSHLDAWRKRLVARPVKNRKGAGPRKPASINREMTSLRAALYVVLPAGMPKTDAAWQEALTPITAKEAVFGRRELYLDKDQRKLLVAHINDEFALPYVRLLASLPVRPGAMAQLTVSLFNRREADLFVPAAIDRKCKKDRHVQLPPEAVMLLTGQSKGKLPGAHLFTMANGKPWDADYWNDPIRVAAKAAGLDPEISAYTLRHSVITDLVAGNTDLNTVATLAGTSIKMLQEHYAHVKADVARKALAALSL